MRRRRTFLGDDISAIRQARRLHFPGQLRVVVLYHPRQFHLARMLSARHEAELWYVCQDSYQPETAGDEHAELRVLHDLAREVASGILVPGTAATARADNQPLRERLVELEIISQRAFVPGARIRHR